MRNENEIIIKFAELICDENTNQNILQEVIDYSQETVSNDHIGMLKGYIEYEFIEEIQEAKDYILFLKTKSSFKFKNENNREYLSKFLEAPKTISETKVKEKCIEMMKVILEVNRYEGYIDENETIDSENYILNFMEIIVNKYNEIMSILNRTYYNIEKTEDENNKELINEN